MSKQECPKCGRSYTDPPALSREDSETEICPECGMREALADFLGLHRSERCNEEVQE